MLGVRGAGPAAEHLPSALSGGEQQRVAVARALAPIGRCCWRTSPRAAWIAGTRQGLDELLSSLAVDLVSGSVVVTHNRALAMRANRVLLLDGGPAGRIVGDGGGGGLMVCDTCRERDAVVHLTQVVDGAVTQVHLCEACARTRGWRRRWRRRKIAAGGRPRSQTVQQQLVTGQSDQTRCSFCQATYKDFREIGAAGVRPVLQRLRAAAA
ncbi:MAG: hypothetical protein U5K74_06215 [Gemmatimonadaceae bacterium]|nr:hypothetical protein [Gemmatimonadaceae bacterium]